MAEKLEDAVFWLPEEFLDEDFFLKESRAAAVASAGKGSYVVDSMESESEEEDHIAGLTRQMAHSFLGDEKITSASNAKVMATSPQSTLCDSGIWSASNEGSPKGPSQVSSPPSTPLEQGKDDAWDILYAAAGQVGRMKQNEQRVSGQGLLIPPKKPPNQVESAASFYRSYNPILTQQQLQAAQFFQLKQQQLIKQQVSAAWSRQNRAARSNRHLGLAPSTWPPLQRQQPGSGMRAVFLNSPGPRRESTGTGVFLPRRAGTHHEGRKKPGCSTVLLPAKVVQALSLNLEDSAVHPRYQGYFSFDHEMTSNRSNSGIPPLQKQHYHHPPPSIVSGHEIRLPQEWTY